MIDPVVAHYFFLFWTLVIDVWLWQTLVIHLSGALVFQDANADGSFSLCLQMQLQRPADVHLHLHYYSHLAGLQSVVGSIVLEHIIITYSWFAQNTCSILAASHLLNSYNIDLAISAASYPYPTRHTCKFTCKHQMLLRYSVFFMSNTCAGPSGGNLKAGLCLRQAGLRQLQDGRQSGIGPQTIEDWPMQHSKSHPKLIILYHKVVNFIFSGSEKISFSLAGVSDSFCCRRPLHLIKNYFQCLFEQSDSVMESYFSIGTLSLFSLQFFLILP